MVRNVTENMLRKSTLGKAIVYLKTVFNLLQQVTNIDDINALLLVHVKGMVDLPRTLKRSISFTVCSQFISD